MTKKEIKQQELRQLKARFFGMHIGCNVAVPKMYGGPADIRNLAPSDLAYCLRDDCGIKLILRPLSDITDEEAIAALTAATGLYLCDVDRNEDRIVAVGVNHSSCAVIWLKISVNQAGTFIQAWNDIKGHSQPDCHDYLAVDYLRSLNFCLPFNGLDPIEEGWAVLEPQTTQS